MSTSSDANLPDAPPPVVADAEVGTEPAAPTAPRSVVASYWMLLVSAALPVLVVIFTLATWNTVVNQLLQQPLPAGTSPAQARSAIHQYLIANIVLDLVFAALYVGFAILMRRGRNWARLSVTAIVALFAVLGVLNNSGLITLASIFIELTAVGLLYTRTSKDYFTAMRSHRR